MAAQHDVVLTGLGTVLAPGAGREPLLAALAAAAPRLTRIDDSDGFHAPRAPRFAALAQHVDMTAWLPAAKARRMSWPSRFTVAAGEMALADARLERGALAHGEVAVAVATSFGTTRNAEQLVREILLRGPENASPALFAESVANAPAAQMAIAAGARGTNLAVTQRESGPLQAVALAARELTLGRCRVAFAGCYEEINPLVHALLGRFQALAQPEADGREVARPFDRRRSGFLAAEGATMVVLETAVEAAARGAVPLARLMACEGAFDPTAPAHGWGRGGEPLAERLLAGLARRGIAPASIDRVVSGASGSVGGDALEAAVLRRVFGGSPPPVLAPQGATGQHAGGLLAAAALAASGAPAWPTGGFAEPDPALGVVPHDGSPLPPARRVLVSALAAGGAAAWLVLDAP
jgi:3-oxoacyl-[acyl-carrier-protein] synthase II